MSTLNIHLLCRRSIDFTELAIFASRSGAMTNLHWLELTMARTIFHGPKSVRAIEVRLYVVDTHYKCLRKILLIRVPITCFHGELLPCLQLHVPIKQVTCSNINIYRYSFT